MGVRSTNTAQSFGSDFYRSGSDVTRAYVNQVYTEDVFHTQLYDGITNGGQTITTNIDLANKGGLVWIKKQDGLQNPVLSDTEQGLEYHGNTSSTSAFGTSNTRVSSPTSTGFNLGSDTEVNEDGFKYVSWTFRKQPGFFDIVTWDGDPGTGGRTLDHSLGSTPGFIIVKQTTGTAKNWAVWHRSFSNLPYGNHMYLNTQGGVVSNTAVFPSTSPTSTQFGVGEFSNVDGESSTQIRVTAIPKSNDVVPVRNQILEIDLVNTTTGGNVDAQATTGVGYTVSATGTTSTTTVSTPSSTPTTSAY